MFVDDQDRCEFVEILKRHLGSSDIRIRRDRNRVKVEGAQLIAGALMATHFHLIIAQRNHAAMTKLMHAVLSAYVRYFNKRHGTKGPMFSGPFRHRRLKNTTDLKWAIAYVHFNPQRLTDRFSTHNAYVSNDPPPWIATAAAMKQFGGRANYLNYMRAFATTKDRLPTADQLFSAAAGSTGTSLSYPYP